MVVVLMYFIKIIFFTLLFVGCNSGISTKDIDLKDCTITVPFQYKINQINKSKTILIPEDKNKSFLHIYFQDKLDTPNGRFKKFLSSYTPSKFVNRDNLKIVDGIDSHLKEKIYFLIGKNFYIVYFKPSKDIDKIISECNQNWKYK